MAKTTKKEVKEGYVVSLLAMGKTHKVEGDTIAEALDKLQKFPFVRGKAILTVSKGDKVKERILSPFALSRLTSTSVLTRQIAIKNTALLFDL